VSSRTIVDTPAAALHYVREAFPEISARCFPGWPRIWMSP
jgi:hypothetical protein